MRDEGSIPSGSTKQEFKTYGAQRVASHMTLIIDHPINIFNLGEIYVYVVNGKEVESW